MTNAKHTTVYDLLMSAPDSQVYALQQAHSDVCKGDWKSAASWMYMAADDGLTEWHDACMTMGDAFYNKAK